MKNMAKWTGVAAVVGGVLVLTGCQSSKVMDNRPYIPAASGDEIPAAMPAETAQVTEVKDLPVAPQPSEAQAASTSEYPQFDSAAIEPVAPATKKCTAKGGVYVVQKGDTISGIAYKHGVRTADVLAVNGLDDKSARRIKVGQKITIPDGKVVRKAPAKQKTVKKTAATATVAAAADGTYTVRRGDNIPKIARKLGVKAKDLMAVNNLDEAATRRLQIGQKLIVPGKGAAAPVADAPVVKDTPAVTETAAETPAAAPAEAAPAEAAPAADKVDAFPASTMETVAADISIREYLKAKNLTMADFKKLNEMTFPSFRPNGEDELDAIIPQGTAIFIPAAPAAAPAAEAAPVAEAAPATVQ